MCENQTYTNNQWVGEEIIWKLEITLRWIKMKMHPTKMYEMPFSKPHSYHDAQRCNLYDKKVIHSTDIFGKETYFYTSIILGAHWN